MADNIYDAIVIGSGISGGWAAKELTEKGLKTIMLERGRNIEHIKDYVSATKNPWEFPHRGGRTQEMIGNYPVLKRDYALNEKNLDFWANEKDSPYSEVKRFDWYRGYQVGGRSLMWGRQSYRLSEMDFEANAKEGIAVDWPIRYKDLEKWYGHVERFAGISGSRNGLPQLPDGDFLPPMEMNVVEKAVAARIKDHYKESRHMLIGRAANLTKAIQGRTNCQFRSKCWLGCPFGGYFSTQSSTLPAAVATGNLTLRPFSIVTKILYDKDTKKATGVEVLDAETNQTYEYFAKVIFLNASTLNSTWVLMNSATDVWEGGLGSSSGELGHNLMDHHFRLGASGRMEGFDDKYVYGRRPNGIYIPRFRNLGSEKRDYLRGFGETLPYHENKVTLDKTKKDKWGLNILSIDAEIKENEINMRKDMMADGLEMLEMAGLKDVKTFDNGYTLGMGIHEMGTARMGLDPKTSVLNKFNQVWDATNVYVTDGAAMTSAACQNPSLTYMAMTARAVDHAFAELKKGTI